MNKMRKFTRSDWQTWSGAEETNYCPAMIGEVEFEHNQTFYTVILDNNGLTVYQIETDSYDCVHIWLMTRRKAPYSILYHIAVGLINAMEHEILLAVIEMVKIQ